MLCDKLFISLFGVRRHTTILIFSCQQDHLDREVGICEMSDAKVQITFAKYNLSNVIFMLKHSLTRLTKNTERR